MIGVNLAGGDFGSLGGVYGTAYTYPTTSEIDYYASKGMNVIRIPFLWERLQSTKFGKLTTSDLDMLNKLVEYAGSKGINVVLDNHNYGKYYGNAIGSAEVPDSAFADFWGKMAAHFASDQNVVFGLMNEPYLQQASQWIDSVNTAIAAIRQAGAKQQILVSGTYWDGAHSWVSTDNDTVIGGGVRDPASNFAFEVHQYLDADSSGTRNGVVSETIGVERLKAITEWAKTTNSKLFLGEFGVGTDAASLAALDNMVKYMDDNASVWIGATYWAGGPWWGDYMFSIEPANGTDKPQMDILERYDLKSPPVLTPTPVPTPAPTPTPAPAPTTSVIKGNNVSETLYGSAGNDTIYAYGGNDRIVGYSGNDILAGGTGRDTFVFNTKADSKLNRDKITDFNVVDDTVHLENGIFTKLKAGTMSTSNVRIGDKALDSNDYIVVNRANGVISYDADGNGAGAAVQFATIENLAKLTYQDFWVI